MDRRDADYDMQHPIHDSVFGDEPEGGYDDTPRGAIAENVNITRVAVQAEGHLPMRSVGDTDQGDRQPDGGRRR